MTRGVWALERQRIERETLRNQGQEIKCRCLKIDENCRPKMRVNERHYDVITRARKCVRSWNLNAESTNWFGGAPRGR